MKKNRKNKKNAKIIRNRANAKGNPIIGNQKRNDYALANAIATKAFNAGFYLEPITLYESLISDRLSSRLNNLGNNKQDFDTLGELIGAMDKENNEKLRNFVKKEISEWKQKRNKALHEIPKREEGDTRTATEKYEECKAIAEEGKKLFNELRNCIDRVRRAENKVKP
jgi:hypothetical protein